MSEQAENQLNPSALRRRTITLQNGGTDLKSPDFHTNPDRFQIFRRLRESAPVFWNAEAEGPGFWAVTRYRDVLQVIQDPESFSADVSYGGMRIFDIQQVTADPRPHLLSMDPPQHTQLRKALMPLFAPAATERIARNLRKRASGLIATIAPKGSAEFVGEIAAPLTLGVLTDLLDVPASDAEQLFRWSNMFVSDDDREMQPSIEARQAAIREMDEYALKLYQERAHTSTDDFVSLIRRATINGKPMDFDTYSVNFGAFMIAANETTRHSISSAMLALSESPEEMAKLVADPRLIAAAAKELIRWATPLVHVRRTATCDVTLAGQLIRRGDKVVVWYSSANRDEQIWTNAGYLDVERFSHRGVPSHLAFGAGPHHCLGWRLAELQVTILFEELLGRLPDIRVESAGSHLRSNFISGLKKLNVRFTPR